MTQIFKINKKNYEIDKIQIASEVLKEGGTVVFPTETVYGLGADALNENAVKKIFIVKGRPSDNPLIVHIWNINQVKDLVTEIPPSFYKLTEKFWPGPLTLVMKKSSKVSNLVTAGLNTIGIRIPDHPIARALLKEANIPISAPSANISGLPSPTKGEHTIKDLNGKVDIIIDGGYCKVGLESTVLDITTDIPIILRPGGITYEQLQDVIGEIKTDKFVYSKTQADSQPKSPGVKYKHYSPKAKVIVIDGCLDRVVEEINKQADNFINQSKKVGILATTQTVDKYSFQNVISVGDRTKPESIAAKFFELLRYFDYLKVDIILVEGINKQGIGMAIMNRMIRAAGYDIIEV